MILGQNHIAVNVSNREKALAFYHDVLGFEVISEEVREHKHDIMIFMNAHGITIELFVDASRPARPTYPEALGLRHLCFTVVDIEEEWARIDALGYKPEPIRLHPGSELRMFFVLDPDGLPIEFHE